VIREVVLRGSLLPHEQRLLLNALSFLQRELGCDAIRARGQLAVSEVCVGLSDWAHPAADILGFDRLFASLRGEGGIRVVLWSRDWLEGTAHALELLTRYQRLLPLPLDFAPMPRLQQILAVHRLLHPLDQPCARASYEHSLDTWRWLLRLDPQAAPALQLAALFHDVGAFVRGCHDRDGCAARAASVSLASMGVACRALEPLGLDVEDLTRMAGLMARYETDSESQARLLSDADLLSFFSLSSWRYLQQYGVEQTQRKVTQALGSMTDTALCLAVLTRQPAAISEMLDDLLGIEPRSEQRPARRLRSTHELAT
jgi:hypothetical protein